MMIPSMMDLLFGCPHTKLGFPITPGRHDPRPEAAAVTGTYVVCLHCGQEFPYDWMKMKVVSARKARAAAAEFWRQKAA